ncbi:MAG: hypothetical protein BGN97_00360 [Microbacterium sp. 69-10]|uniref:hypothetical protein n=1 Tax=Microbacterium sp. 69-10 TaxID=1895783 RepID=UPI000969B8B7|nr:hypothetical protein [Microbacterium sp. 69-10]OJU39707.1 MAG: hypothetical protein BGN97_00360 [Microbacterium sp. 69-10]
MSTKDELSINIVNYPPSGSEVSLQTVAFGPVGPMRLMVEIDSEDASTDIKITVGNAAEHAELGDFLRDMAELLTAIAESDETEEAIESAIVEEAD